MARTRRRAPAVRKHRDWVYRSNSQSAGTGTGALVVDGLGTYEFAVRSLTTGAAAAQVLWLVDAEDRDQQYMRAGALGANTLLNSAARPAPARRKVLMTEGQIYVEPTSWAIGNLIALGLRVGVFEQDQMTGLASLDADYTMWNGPVPQQSAAIFANDRQLNLYEKRTFISFSDNGSAFSFRFRARVNWTLQPHHGLGLYLEGESTSVNIRYQTWCRTLVEA